MARRVHLHIGLPKTATSYLQTILWGSREQLRADGLLLPGDQRRDHLWSSRVIREDPNLAAFPEVQQTAWERVRTEVAGWSGDALISHEFLAAASAEQAGRAIEALAPAEVHLVVTAREPLGLFAASWQESLKNRATTPMADYSRSVSGSANAVWNWRTLDLRLVLGRWARHLPAERVHVLPLPGPGSAREEIWLRFAGVLGLDGSSYDLSGSFPNQSMGVAEAETLRRVNEELVRLDDFTANFDKGVYLRTHLADQLLVPREGDRFWPMPDQVEDCRRRGEEAIEFIRDRGYQVVGDLEDLRVPAELPERRTPDSVTDSEVAEVAVAVVASLLGDVRDLRSRVAELEQRDVNPDDRGAPRVVDEVIDRARDVLQRARRRT